jgi:group II intron reverse transcriptase/maturase
MPIEDNSIHSKGLEFYCKEGIFKLMSYTEMKTTEFKLILIANHARRDKGMKFTSLAHLLNTEYLTNGFMRLNRNKACGIDKVSWADYNENLEENIANLVNRLKDKSYKPIASRRVYIPKGDGKFRPLGISAIENKIVEFGIKRILESIYEQDFSEQSFGFRPFRSCHDALKETNSLITYKRVNHIVEADIKGFFDNVSHEYLMDFLRIRISDKTLLMLIEKFLKVGYLEDGLLQRSDMGTPQGGILSPILANIFLHYVLDVWFENTVKKHVKGYCELVRYADDFICVVQQQESACKIEIALKNRFNRFGLEIHPEKSGLFSFGRFERINAKRQNRHPNTFDFLGFTHFCSQNRKGGFKVGRKTSKKKFTAKCKDMKLWIKKNRNKTNKIVWKNLSLKLNGHYQYYGVSENYKSIKRFYENAKELLFKWLNRRSQKKSMNWEQFNKYLEHYPLPKPQIKCSFYT